MDRGPRRIATRQLPHEVTPEYESEIGRRECDRKMPEWGSSASFGQQSSRELLGEDVLAGGIQVMSVSRKRRGRHTIYSQFSSGAGVGDGLFWRTGSWPWPSGPSARPLKRAAPAIRTASPQPLHGLATASARRLCLLVADAGLRFGGASRRFLTSAVAVDGSWECRRKISGIPGS